LHKFQYLQTIISAIPPLLVPIVSHSLDPARCSLPIVPRKIRIGEVDYSVMKKPATPINIAAQDPTRTVEAAPVWVAMLPATVLVVGDGMTREPLKAGTEAALVMPVGATATVVLKTVLSEVKTTVVLLEGEADDVIVADEDPPVAVSEVVADAEADLVLEAAAVGTVFPAAKQELANACMAAFALEPQRLVICDSTFEASTPHIVERSAGLVSVLTAASRQAGGEATASLEQAVKRAKRI